MGTITTITMYQTEDGEQHEGLEAAQRHDSRLELTKALETEFGISMRASPTDVAVWILENFDLKAK